ncbi:MAG: M23 family metallopeptidase [Bdellovibrio sp.]
MNDKKITLFMMSSESGETQKLTISARRLKIALSVGTLCGVALVALLIDYFGLLIETSENKRLKAENAMMRKNFEIVEGKLGTLESSLERIRTFTTKLKLITNIDSEDRALKLSMNPEPAPHQAVEEMDVPMDQRESLGQLEKAESGVAVPYVDESQGELSIAGNRDYQTLIIRMDRGMRESNLREQSVLDLWESLSEKQSLMNAIPNIRPARGWITSRFGYRVSPFTGRPSMHTGLDIAAAPGSPVYAPADGLVTFAGYDEGYGKMVTVDHGHGYQSRYGHLANFYVQVGQRVSRYDIVASVGNTGRSTGPHLHYEVRLNSVPKNPAHFILDD